jgi:hypothetical protein
MKHALVVRKKCCRAQTGAAWKQLRASMEHKLAERLAAAQRRLDEELAFVQVGSWQGRGCSGPCLLFTGLLNLR